MIDLTPANRYWRYPRYWSYVSTTADHSDINAILMSICTPRRGGYLNFRSFFVTR